MTNSNDSLSVAYQAFEKFKNGLAAGRWEPFIEMLTDDFTFWFPIGQFQGVNVGKEKAKAFFQYVSEAFSEGLTIELERVTSNETTVVFEALSQGQLRGTPYKNQVAISLDVRGEKICGYREYLAVVMQPSTHSSP